MITLLYLLLKLELKNPKSSVYSFYLDIDYYIIDYIIAYPYISYYYSIDIYTLILSLID